MQHGYGAVVCASPACQAQENGNFWKSGNRLHFPDRLSPEDGNGSSKPPALLCRGRSEERWRSRSEQRGRVQVMPGVLRGEGSSAIPPPRPSCPEVSGARGVCPRGVCPRGVRGASSGAPALLTGACSPRALSRGHGYKMVCGRFGGKWEKCMVVNGTLGQSDICERLCALSFSSLIWKGRLDIWEDHGALETISRFLNLP